MPRVGHGSTQIRVKPFSRGWTRTGRAENGTPLLEVALFAALRLRTTVTDRELRVTFFPFYWKTVPVEQIDTFEAIRYNALMETGGWGVKHSRRHGRVLNVRGDRAVAITAGRTRTLIGTQRADDLVAALTAAAGPR